jgi:hypothetical protein
VDDGGDLFTVELLHPLERPTDGFVGGEIGADEIDVDRRGRIAL